MTFKNWLLNCSDYSKYGLLAVDVENDKAFPDTDSYIGTLGYLIENNAGEMTKQLFQDAWNEYNQKNE